MLVSHEMLSITIKDSPVEVLGILGAGGSKTVLDISLSGLRRALAIPNRTDPKNVQDEKWELVASEADNARLLSELGLLTIPDYALEDIVLNGDARKGLLMTPFSDLPFEVFDGKDGSRTWEQGPLSDIEHFSRISERMLAIKEDISRLAGAGVVLNSDSISFACMPDGTMRLFLYDLQGMSVTDQADELSELPMRYAQLVTSKLDNVFDFRQSQRFAAQGYDLNARQRLATTLINELP